MADHWSSNRLCEGSYLDTGEAIALYSLQEHNVGSHLENGCIGLDSMLALALNAIPERDDLISDHSQPLHIPQKMLTAVSPLNRVAAMRHCPNSAVTCLS
jgi:hypothetical protein